jgi:dihydroorotate dehydrogenase
MSPGVYAALFWLLRRLPAETAHHLAFGSLRAALSTRPARAIAHRLFGPRDRSLEVTAFGVRFESPIGLAAGFDKDGLGPDALGALGFAFVEVGTVTAEAQPGNDRPRMFRLVRDRALLNRMGFNNRGAAHAAARLAARRPSPTVVGVNIGKTKVVAEADAAQDYAKSAELVAPHAAYCVVNVSSPNTPGLRNLQATSALRPILSEVQRALDRGSPSRRVPLLVKIAPDLADEDVDAVADLALELGLDGIVATNTTLSREGLATPADEVSALGAGGISGAPVKARALSVLRRLRARVGTRLVLVSVGGIEDADDAWARIVHGAHLVQVYTGFIYNGPLFAKRLHEGLRARLRASGHARIEDAVGSAATAEPRETPCETDPSSSPSA